MPPSPESFSILGYVFLNVVHLSSIAGYCVQLGSNRDIPIYLVGVHY